MKIFQFLQKWKLVIVLRKKFHYGAVTGTNGKTTITTLLYEMLKIKMEKAIVAGKYWFSIKRVSIAA